MPKKTKPLSDTEIKQAKPREKVYYLFDGDGLALRVKPSGAKLWLFYYQRPYTKARASLSFGPYHDLTLLNARIKRNEARELLAQDIDPMEHRDEVEQSQLTAHTNTLEHIAAQWFEIKKTTLTPGYADSLWRSLELHVFPALGKLPIHKIKAPATITTLKPVAAKGSLETVKRLAQRINEIMTYAVNTGLLQANPLTGIGKAFQTPDKKNMPALKPDELPELMRTLTTASIKITTRCLIEWQLHTMVRPSEAAGTQWSEIDFDNKQWLIPAERMKKKKPHTVPLSPQAMGLLEAMNLISSERKHVFAADRDPNSHTHVQTANMALKRMGFGGRLVAHGLRSIASTTLNEQGFDSDVIEAALAHTDSNEVRAAYNRSEYLERRLVMMKWWSEHIERAATGNMSLSAGIKTMRVVN